MTITFVIPSGVEEPCRFAANYKIGVIIGALAGHVISDYFCFRKLAKSEIFRDVSTSVDMTKARCLRTSLPLCGKLQIGFIMLH
jgi:hypothetical protein